MSLAKRRKFGSLRRISIKQSLEERIPSTSPTSNPITTHGTKNTSPTEEIMGFPFHKKSLTEQSLARLWPLWSCLLGLGCRSRGTSCSSSPRVSFRNLSPWQPAGECQENIKLVQSCKFIPPCCTAPLSSWPPPCQARQRWSRQRWAPPPPCPPLAERSLLWMKKCHFQGMDKKGQVHIRPGRVVCRN